MEIWNIILCLHVIIKCSRLLFFAITSITYYMFYNVKNINIQVGAEKRKKQFI